MIRFGGPKFPREQGEAFGDVEEEGIEVYIYREREAMNWRTMDVTPLGTSGRSKELSL